MFSMFLSLLLLFSTVAGTSRVYANESNKVYPITSEIANNFAEMSEIAAKSYDVKDEGIKSAYIELSKNEIENEDFVVHGNKSNLNFEEINVVKMNLDGSEYTAVPVTGAVCAACIGGICAIGAGDIAGIVACFKS